jgi:type IV pilus assembly protein PilB
MDRQVLKYFVINKILLPEDVQKYSEQALKANQSLRDFFIKNNIIDEEEFAKALADIENLPYINLKDKKIGFDIINHIPYKIAKKYQIISFAKKENILKIGLVDPKDLKSKEKIDLICQPKGLKPKYYVISQTSWIKAEKNYKKIEEQVSEVLKEVQKETYQVKRDVARQDMDFEEVVKSAPIPKIVNIIVKHAIEIKASDIHIEPTKNFTKIRFRIDGVLRTLITIPNYLQDALISRIKVLANLKLDESRVPQDGRIKMEINKKNIDLRISVFPLMEKEKAVIRILDISGKILSLKELGFRQSALDLIDKAIHKSHGLFLVTGPTGSGKSTTLYSILNVLNSDSINIATLEDPTEFYVDGINQSQVKPEIGFTFANGLRSILRQDPDVIMVGEIRDQETAELAVHAALTGHIVFSTMHTGNALKVAPRLFDMKVQPFLLNNTLEFVIAQRLVRKICPFCKKEVFISSYFKKIIYDELKKINSSSGALLSDCSEVKFYKGEGCEKCNYEGYKGRICIAEVLLLTDQLKYAISENMYLPLVDKALKEQNFITMRQDGFIKALNGITGIEEILRVMRF